LPLMLGTATVMIATSAVAVGFLKLAIK